MANPYGKPTGGFLEDYSLLSGAGAAFQGFAKGMEDAEDRQLKRQEMDAKMKAHQSEVQRHAIELKLKGLEHNKNVNSATGEITDAPLTPKQEAEKTLKETTEGLMPDPNNPGKLIPNPNTPKMIGIEATRTNQAASANKTTEGENASAGYVRRMEAAEKKFQNLLAGGFDPASMKVQAQGALGGPLEGLKSGQVKQYQQMVKDFASAVLRKESGAAISAQEYADVNSMYFPQAGDTEAVKQQKLESRQQAIANFKASAGKAYAKTPSVPIKKGAVPTGAVPTGYVVPKVGTIEDGHRFKGGDPANKNNWEKVN